MVLQASGISLEAERHTERKTLHLRGQARHHSAACNTGLGSEPAGVFSRAGGVQVPWRVTVHGGHGQLAPGLSTHHSGPCGQTQAGRRLPGAHQNCSISVASVPPASVSAASGAPRSLCLDICHTA